MLIQLIEYIQVTNRIDLLTAVQLALQEVIGAYAIAVLDRENPDEIIAARKSSPLVVRYPAGSEVLPWRFRCHPHCGIYGQGGLSGGWEIALSVAARN